MIDPGSSPRCGLCGTPSSRAVLDEAGWLSPRVRARLLRDHPAWRPSDGACPACVQEALLRVLLARGDAALHEGIQAVWPLDVAAAFGALPTPLRMHADARYTGRGVTIAFVDAAFFPHPDLTSPTNRIRAFVDASQEPLSATTFGPDERPSWPGSDRGAPPQWHGLMTSAVASGNGQLSRGLYRGLASEADLVLIQVREPNGRITSQGIARALRFVLEQGQRFGVRIVSLSVAGDDGPPRRDDPADLMVAELVDAGVIVIAAAGNDGVRSLVPPATAPQALTVGGLDDKNSFDHAAVEIWHSNYGASSSGASKPEMVAPSLWVVAPLLPGTSKAEDARRLFAARAAGDEMAEGGIRDRHLITPHYHHVDGTSVAAPLVASAAACALQANPRLGQALLRQVLLGSCRPVPGAPPEQQGRGALDAGQAVARALRERHGALENRPASPTIGNEGVTFLLHDHDARLVRVQGSWDDWREPGVTARLIEPGLWQADLPRPSPGRYEYKLRLDDVRWLDDPDNPLKVPDGSGRLNSVLILE